MPNRYQRPPSSQRLSHRNASRPARKAKKPAPSTLGSAAEASSPAPRIRSARTRRSSSRTTTGGVSTTARAKLKASVRDFATFASMPSRLGVRAWPRSSHSHRRCGRRSMTVSPWTGRAPRTNEALKRIRSPRRRRLSAPSTSAAWRPSPASHPPAAASVPARGGPPTSHRTGRTRRTDDRSPRQPNHPINPLISEPRTAHG